MNPILEDFLKIFQRNLTLLQKKRDMEIKLSMNPKEIYKLEAHKEAFYTIQIWIDNLLSNKDKIEERWK